MPIYDDILKGKRWNANTPSINEHFQHIRMLFPKMFEGKFFNTYMQDAIKSASKVLSDARIGDAQLDLPWARLPGGVGSSLRAKFIAAVEEALQEAMKGLEPLPPRGPSISTYDPLKAAGSVVVAPGLEARLSKDFKTKIASVFDYGNTYRGHGPTTALGAGVLHAHVGNGDGIAFSWAGAVLTIHAVGKKSDAAASGNSGYTWTRG